MKLKNKFIKRFSAVFCACMIACLSFLAVIGFSPKNEKISASAEEEIDIVQYYLKVPSGFILGSRSGSSNFYNITSASYFFYLSNDNFFGGGGGIRSTISYGIPCFVKSVTDISTYESALDSLQYISEFNAYSLDGGITYQIYDDCYFHLIPSYVDFLLESLDINFPLNSNFITAPLSFIRRLVFSCDNFYDMSFMPYNEYSTPTEIPLILYRYEISLDNVQNQIDQAFNNGYTQGQIVGKIEGVQQGVDQVSVNTASKNIFESSAVRNLVDVSTGQSTDIQLAFEPAVVTELGNSMSLPEVYRLYCPNYSSISPGVYRVSIYFQPFVNYSDNLLRINSYKWYSSEMSDLSYISNVRGAVYSSNSDINGSVQAMEFVERDPPSDTAFTGQ